jgi:hypothetical protein
MSAAVASFALVFLRAVQQLNVIHDRVSWAVATSFAIAFAEVAVVLMVVDKGWTAAPWVGLGGAAGVTSAMTMHRWARGAGHG